MKKITLMIAVVILLCSFPAAHAARVGDAVGNIYATDILAYIDGAVIPSYNIGGKTVVSENDLTSYGFQVVWDAENRYLSINSLRSAGEMPGLEISRGRVGAVVGRVYHTDIKVAINSIEVDAYNIGGTTMIALEDFGGSLPLSNPNEEIGYTMNGFQTVWSEAERTISLNVMRENSEIRVGDTSYIVNDLVNEIRTSQGTLIFIEDKDNFHIYAQGYMTNLHFYSEGIFQAIFSEGWKIENGKLTILINQDIKKVTANGINDENVSNYVGCFVLESMASNAISPATIPMISMPVEVIFDKGSVSATIECCIYRGELLFHAGTILELAQNKI